MTFDPMKPAPPVTNSIATPSPGCAVKSFARLAAGAQLGRKLGLNASRNYPLLDLSLLRIIAGSHDPPVVLRRPRVPALQPAKNE